MSLPPPDSSYCLFFPWAPYYSWMRQSFARLSLVFYNRKFTILVPFSINSRSIFSSRCFCEIFNLAPANTSGCRALKVVENPLKFIECSQSEPTWSMPPSAGLSSANFNRRNGIPVGSDKWGFSLEEGWIPKNPSCFYDSSRRMEIFHYYLLGRSWVKGSIHWCWSFFSFKMRLCSI